MRRIGLSLLALAGCNQVFGIKDTQKAPDAADPVFAGKMQWAAAKTVNGAPMGIEEFPIGTESVDSAALSLKIGPALGTGDLTDVAYDKNTGGFMLPFRLAGQPWRLVYVLPGDTVAHEIQWAVQQPDLVIPRMTRKGATAPPPGSGYDIQPTPATSFVSPYVATSGAFTVGYASMYSGNRVQYSMTTDATAINGPLSAPDATDWVLTMDWSAVSSTASQVAGWGMVTGTTLSSALTPVTPTWTTSPVGSVRPLPALTAAKTRLRAALGSLDANDSNVEYNFYQRMTYGISPNLDVYGFTEPAVDCGTTTATASTTGFECLPQPAMIPLSDDSVFDPVIQAPDLAPIGITNPPVMYARVTQTRPVHGVSLTSGIQSMVTTPNPLVSGESIDLLSSTVPTAALVDQATLDTFDLSGASGPVSQDVAVTATMAPRSFTFHPRLGQDGAPLATADDFIVTLYQIQNADTPSAKLHAVRIFHITDYVVGVKIEGALLPPGLYVFSITSRVGFPNAAKGDFKTVAYPLGVSTEFTRQFVVQ